MDSAGRSSHSTLGYEFASQEEAREAAESLDRAFGGEELVRLRVFRIRWNGDFLVEAGFSQSVSEERLADARALLDESGSPVHPEDLEDYKRATGGSSAALPDWVRRLFGG